MQDLSHTTYFPIFENTSKCTILHNLKFVQSAYGKWIRIKKCIIKDQRCVIEAYDYDYKVRYDYKVVIVKYRNRHKNKSNVPYLDT